MKTLRQLQGLVDQMPLWGQVLVGIGLLVYSVLSIYGRMNPNFGKKIFSKIPAEEIRTNKIHIIGYTIIPVVVTIGYLILLGLKYGLV